MYVRDCVFSIPDTGRVQPGSNWTESAFHRPDMWEVVQKIAKVRESELELKAVVFTKDQAGEKVESEQKERLRVDT